MNNWSLKKLEKLAYLITISGVTCGGGWLIYRKNVLEAEEKAEWVKKIEKKYLKRNPENMI